MDPQYIKKGETAVDFATRVQKLIARRAGLVPVQFDGYMKHWRPSKRYMQAQQKVYAGQLVRMASKSAILDKATVDKEMESMLDKQKKA